MTFVFIVLSTADFNWTTHLVGLQISLDIISFWSNSPLSTCLANDASVSLVAVVGVAHPYRQQLYRSVRRQDFHSDWCCSVWPHLLSPHICQMLWRCLTPSVLEGGSSQAHRHTRHYPGSPLAGTHAGTRCRLRCRLEWWREAQDQLRWDCWQPAPG